MAVEPRQRARPCESQKFRAGLDVGIGAAGIAQQAARGGGPADGESDLRALRRSQASRALADPVMPEPPAGRTWNVLPAEKLKLGAARMLTGKNNPNSALVEVSTNPLA